VRARHTCLGPEEIFSSKTASSQINYWQPVGTLSVAAVLRKAGHEVRFINGAFLSHEQVLAEVSRFRPDLVGLYATTFGWNKARTTAADLKRRYRRDCFIVAGGPYPIAVQDRCLVDADIDIDAVVTGEGEYTMLEIMDRLKNGENLKGFPASCTGKACASSGTLRGRSSPISTPCPSPPGSSWAMRTATSPAGHVPEKARGRNDNLAGLQQALHLLFSDGQGAEKRDPLQERRNVMEEIELCIRQGYKEIKFLDDTFAADYDRAMEIAREVRRRGFSFSWFASACVNQVDRPLLQAFKDAGCWAILFGAESGVQKNLDTIRKGTTLEQIRTAVRTAQDVGLKVSTPFMFGIPEKRSKRVFRP